MTKTECDKIITEYVKPIFGFALKRCRTVHDAEDLTQEITLRVLRTLLARDDIADVGKYVWTVAHNILANYYRDSTLSVGSVCIDDVEETLCTGDDDIADKLAALETAERLRAEIAYLSKLQRRCVIAYYYEGKKQADISAELGIPVGTVKWHLFEAKRDLKRGMETMRTHSQLKFDPIKFAICGTNGSVGSKGSNSNFFVSALSQNIEYVTRFEPKGIGEIADALGVSPVYVESEAEYLEEYGFLTKQGDKYLCNILLDEPTSELNALHDEMYEGRQGCSQTSFTMRCQRPIYGIIRTYTEASTSRLG